MNAYDIYAEPGQLRRPWRGRSACMSRSQRLWFSMPCSLTDSTARAGVAAVAEMPWAQRLVSSVPLPANPTETTNVLATESKGLSKSQPAVQEKEPEAIPIPDKNAKIKKAPPVKSATQRKAETGAGRVESNTVWRGWAGQQALQHERGRRQRAELNLPGGGGDFGTRLCVVCAGGAAKSPRELAEV